MPPKSAMQKVDAWNSPVPEARWRGFRERFRGVSAFSSKEKFELALLDELNESLSDEERRTLARLLSRGYRNEIEAFVRTHGANPLFDPTATLDAPLNMAEADRVLLDDEPTVEAVQSILAGDVAHVLFQAGEATRFAEGPFYNFSPVLFARRDKTGVLQPWLNLIDEKARALSNPVAAFLTEGTLGPKQGMFLRAGVRRLVAFLVAKKTISKEEAVRVYTQALQKQNLLFFVSGQGDVAKAHNAVLKKYLAFGFSADRILTLEQDLVAGLHVSEDGRPGLASDPLARDAAGHLYALCQAARPAAFYAGFGQKPPAGQDAFARLLDSGARVLNIIRINDMDRQTVEIVNPRAYSHALRLFARGFKNAIEAVSNPEGQKGGTGITFFDPETHYLTETHENSFPAFSQATEAAHDRYREKYEGLSPAYNAMRQWADLEATRKALIEDGGRLVFVLRQKVIGGVLNSYLGADLPMGDLSLLTHHYRSRLFQFVRADGRELQIHDMKQKEHLPIGLRTILAQLEDPFILAATQEILSGAIVPFDEANTNVSAYGAPAPEIGF